jgi:methylthioribose-1-phosphate isomerase
MPISTITWENHCVRIIDQTLLPRLLKFIDCRDVKALWWAIKKLQVRGAPALGVAAAFGVLLGLQNSGARNRKGLIKELEKVCDYLGSSRPTAVNLFNGLAAMRAVPKQNPQADVETLKDLLRQKAFEIFHEDRRVCRTMAEHGQQLLKSGDRVLTICNAGALATVDYGTALGVFYRAKSKGKRFQVYACETRPLLQGARLTAWELQKSKIDVTLICDNMAATLMRQGKIDKVFTGADRIAANGDTANKIGTYNLAVLAKFHKIPLYVVAPLSTFDLKIKSGRQIPIEERPGQEITHIFTQKIAPDKIKVYNPAFDVTDHQLISAIVTECGIVRAPDKTGIRKLFLKKKG